MSAQLLFAFIVFSFSISIAPGAGNIALLSLSSRYGFVAVLPFIAGSALGVSIILVGSSLGLTNLLSSEPMLYTALKVLGTCYLLYLAWSISTLKLSDSETDKQTGFFSGTLVQILNPKAWVASLTLLTQFLPGQNRVLSDDAVIMAIFIAIGVSSMCIWAYCGSALNKLLTSPKYFLWVNRGLGASLGIVAIVMAGQSI
ncbi:MULTISPECIES: LysE family translocator [Vibrio]|uniref:LysE family translocator n=1 Tax=Vibrio TaxID=662 RepID=UPI0004DD33C2|nr:MULTISPECIES: LysE family translocator [Vibrio]KFA98044.1 threonine transporter RhtB [Vibrio sp. ER1A]MCG9628140.1 LysE family translocator [Vibrio mediterranei]NOH31138.1 LysE family translocator [Vibrio mediterranei]NOI24688.1 LysE family translocator [Vibrio mediterranei]